MTTTSAELLRMLGSVIAPQGLEGPSQAASTAGGLDFASLLKQASQGDLSSGLPVTIGKDAGVQLSQDQLNRIAAAADQAQAQGSTRALVLIDGKALNLDVAVRQITGEANLKAGGVLTGIDSVVSVPAAAGSNGPGALQGNAVVPLPRAGYASPSLLRLLGQEPPSS